MTGARQRLRRAAGGAGRSAGGSGGGGGGRARRGCRRGSVRDRLKPHPAPPGRRASASRARRRSSSAPTGTSSAPAARISGRLARTVPPRLSTSAVRGSCGSRAITGSRRALLTSLRAVPVADQQQPQRARRDPVFGEVPLDRRDHGPGAGRGRAGAPGSPPAPPRRRAASARAGPATCSRPQSTITSYGGSPRSRAAKKSAKRCQSGVTLPACAGSTTPGSRSRSRRGASRSTSCDQNAASRLPSRSSPTASSPMPRGPSQRAAEVAGEDRAAGRVALGEHQPPVPGQRAGQRGGGDPGRTLGRDQRDDRHAQAASVSTTAIRSWAASATTAGTSRTASAR